MRADTRGRASGHPRSYSRAEEAADEPSFSRIRRDARQVSVRPGEGLLPEDLVPGSAGSLLDFVGRGDQAEPHPRFLRIATDAQTEPDAGSEEPISDHQRRGAPTKHGDRQVSPRRRSGSQLGSVARHEVDLRPGTAPLLQGVRPVRVV